MMGVSLLFTATESGYHVYRLGDKLQNQVHLVRSSIPEKVATTIVAHICFFILPFAIFSFAFAAKAAAINLGDAVRIVPPANVNSPTQLGTEPRSVTPLGISNSVATEMASIPNQRTMANSPLSNINTVGIDTTLTASAMVMKSDVNQLTAIEPIDGANAIMGPKTIGANSLGIPLKDVLPGGTYNVGSTYREDAQSSIPRAPRSATYFDGQIGPTFPFQGGTYKPDAAITPQSYTVSVTSSANPSIFGSSLSLTASINTPSGAAQSGSVTFTDNGVIVGIADVVAGTAILPVSSTTNAQATLCAGAACLGPGTLVKYVSQLGCAYQDTDLMYGGGHDDTACINSALASATEANPIILWQDGKSAISGNGIQGPAAGYWGIIGNGGDITTVHITGCSISGGMATLTTETNALVAGQTILLTNFTTCSNLNGYQTQVSATGLSSTQFQVPAGGADPPTAENATASSVSGTGFYLGDWSSGDVISNNVMPISNGCEVPDGPAPNRGTHVLFRDFVINGNARHNGQYCFGIDLNSLNNIRIEDVMFYNTPRYAIKVSNVGNMVVTGSKFVASYLGNGTNADGIHVDGPANDLVFSNDYFQTGDDTVALNATEGYCGPISRVKWTNSTLDDTFDAIRMYNGDLDICSNGMIPLIDTVDLDNVNGSVYLLVANLGNSVTSLGNLNPAITNVQWNNSAITKVPNTSLYIPPAEFFLTDNVGNMALNDFTFISPDSPGFFGENIVYGLTDHIGSLILNNFTVERTPTGNRLDTLFSAYSSGLVQIGSLNINGFAVIDSGGSYGQTLCLLCSTYYWGFAALQTNLDDINYGNLSNSTAAYSSAFNVTTPYAFGPYQPFNEFSVGQHTIIASYGGDQNNPPSVSPPLVQTVQAAGTSTTITSGDNPSISSTPLTLTCTVTGTALPSGTVTIRDGTEVIGTGILNMGEAAIIASGLTPGVHSLTATYSGDIDSQSSTSLAILQTVTQSTTVELTSSQNPELTLNRVIFTAKVVSASNKSPTGSVAFTDGATTLGTAILDPTGSAMINVGPMQTGQHSVVASYEGDMQNLPSISSTLNQLIQLRNTDVSVMTSFTGNQQVSLTSIINFTGPVVPTGTITLFSNGAAIGTSTVDTRGSATITIGAPGAPIYGTAIYSGDMVYAGSNATGITIAGPPYFTIQLNPSSLSLPFQQSGTSVITLVSSNGFTDSMSLRCLDLPSAMSCSFTGADVALGANQSKTVQLIIDSKSVLVTGSQRSGMKIASRAFVAICLLPVSWVFGCCRWKDNRLRRSMGRLWFCALVVSVGLVSGLEGCGGLQISGTPPGIYAIKVAATGTASGLTETAEITVNIAN